MVRLTPESDAELLRLGTATLFEASKLPIAFPSRLRPVWKGSAVVGRALPVNARAGDNLALHIALEEARVGDVLVVDGQNAPHGYWGEVMTVMAIARGVRGLIIDGGVRDTQRLEALAFPVWSSHVAILGTSKSFRGTIGAPLPIGAAVVRRGDVVIADADGVVAIPETEVDRVREAGLRREAEEASYFERLRDGESTMQIYGFSVDA